MAASSGARTASAHGEAEKARIERSGEIWAIDELPSGALAHALKRRKCLGSPNHSSMTMLASENPKTWPRSELFAGDGFRSLRLLLQADNSAAST